jgi:CheY-like chemotaxis protein
VNLFRRSAQGAKALQVLVVDDEPDVRLSLREILERAGHEVVEANDGSAAIRAYRRSRPACTITDILLPRKGGLHLIREILELNPAAKILAISGGGQRGKLNFLSTARTFPGVRTLKKPFQIEDLFDVLDEMFPNPSPDPHPL